MKYDPWWARSEWQWLGYIPSGIIVGLVILEWFLAIREIWKLF